MQNNEIKYYPTILKAIHLIVLYLFIQAIVDFPLALIDYFEGSNYLQNPIKSFVLNIGATIFILYYGYKQSKTSWSNVFPIRFFNPLLIILIIIFFSCAHILLEVVNYWVAFFIPIPSWFGELLDNVVGKELDFWSKFINVAIFAPIVEELIFRGIILQGFKKNYSTTTAVVVSALLFALFHLNPWQFPATFTLGLLLGWLTIRTNSIVVAIIGHAINNTLVLLTVTYWEDVKSSPIYSLDSNTLYLLCAVIIVISIGLMYWITKRKKVKQP